MRTRWSGASSPTRRCCLRWRSRTTNRRSAPSGATSTQLDKDGHADDTIAHLEALVTAGLLNQIPPHWSSVRWRHISPRKELAVVDQSYRDLERIGDLVSTHVTLSAEEKKYLDDGGHFWPGAVCGYSQGYLRSTGARGDECAWRGESPQGPCGLHDGAHHGQRRSDVE